MEGADQDFPLPRLAPHLKLARAPDAGGEPFWTLHDPASNAYFKIDWVAFECLSRFHQFRSAAELKAAVERETTLEITIRQIEDIVAFLQQSGLVLLRDQKVIKRAKPIQKWWKTLLHTYLYIPVPLFKPQAFLERAYPKIAFLFRSWFVQSVLAFLALMVLWTLPRLDEFFHTFNAFFSIEGIVATLVVFAFVKIVHEWAHAFAAVRYGVQVPHMGVAFIIMYPVLYTETTGSWALSSRRARFHIAVAGIVAELCLAAVALGLWHILPAGGLGQSVCFLVVCVSLVSSLVVNLNPLMRFDGYYMLSDVTGFDNLQSRSCNFARYALRETLFDLQDSPPESLPQRDQRFLTLFGFALLTYRFFLFLGIALLVYHLFFQPLGFFLMMVELMWFIGMPVWSELKIWYQRRADILARRRSLVPAISLALLVLVLVVPWKSTMMLPAVAHASEHRVLYAPAPSEIVMLSVNDGQKVKAGDVLVSLRAPDLEFKLRKAEQDVRMLETLRRRAQSNPVADSNPALSEAVLEKARVQLHTLKDQQARLEIKAPFDGIVRDLNPAIQAGRFIGVNEAMLTLINPESGTMVTAFAVETVRNGIEDGATAEFLSMDRQTTLSGLSLSRVSDGGQTSLDWPELSSLYGGPVAADEGPDGALVSRRALYRVEATGTEAMEPMARTGYLKVSTPPQSIIFNFFRWLGGLIRQEAALG